MNRPLHVLMVEDSEDDVLLLIQVLKKGGYDPEYERVETAEAMRTALGEKTWDVILCDYQMPEFNGLAAIALLKETQIDIPLIIVSGAIGEETAVECLRLGAHDYVMKGNLSRLDSAIERELKEAESRLHRKQAEEDLRASEERFKAIFNQGPLGIALIDAMTGSIRTANPMFAKIVDRSIEGMTHFDWMSLTHPDDVREILDNIALLNAGRITIFQTTVRFLHPDDTIVWINMTITPLAVEDKLYPLHVCMIEDITGRKQAEETLRETEELFRSYLEYAPDGVYMSDLEGNFLYGNRKCEEITGYRREELIGKNFLELNILPEKYMNKAAQLLQVNIEGKATGPDEIELISKEGRLIPLEINTNVVQRMGSSIVLAFVRDITKRKRARDEMAILADIGRVIGSTLEIDKVYERVAAEIGKLIIFDNLVVNLFNAQQETLNVAYVSGLDIPGRRVGDSYPVQGTVWDESFRTRKGMIVQLKNPEDFTEKFPSLIVSFRAGILSVMSIPLITHNEVIGNLIMRSKKSFAYTEEDLLLAEKIGMEIAGAIANAQLFSERKQAEEELQQSLETLRKAIGTTVQVMVSAVEARDPYTSGHQIRSADLARAIATEMGLPQEKIDGIRMASSIHDIGKLSVPAEILSKPTKLSELEFSLIKEHACRGFKMLKDVESPWPLAEIIYQHHERMDGSGYPRHLKGDDILIEARILNVADVVEAMASHRPYRPSLGIEAALEEIEKNKGVLYDNTVADACLRLFREKGFRVEGA